MGKDQIKRIRQIANLEQALITILTTEIDNVTRKSSRTNEDIKETLFFIIEDKLR